MIVLMIIALTGLNYLTYYGLTYQHAFYRILLYIPLVLGSFWFGIRGSVIIAISTIVLFFPYIMAHWRGFSLEDFHEILEGCLYFAIALILGVLVERERKRQKVLVETESLAAVGRAVFEVAHDMKAPLMSIGGFATQLSRALEKEDPKQRKLEVIISETARLEAMVREMLDFGRPTELQFKSTDLNVLAGDVIEAVRPVAERARIALGTDLDPVLCALMLDGPKIKQVILNLVMNAMEAGAAGGHVVVKTAANQHTANLFVIDDGSGIAPEDAEKIFEPFFTKKKKGTGLGLSIVKKIVEAHGGGISSQSNREKGVTFTVRFPIDINL